MSEQPYGEGSWTPPQESRWRRWGIRIWKFLGNNFFLGVILSGDFIFGKGAVDIFKLSTFFSWQIYTLWGGVFVWKFTFNTFSEKWGLKSRWAKEKELQQQAFDEKYSGGIPPFRQWRSENKFTVYVAIVGFSAVGVWAFFAILGWLPW